MAVDQVSGPSQLTSDQIDGRRIHSRRMDDLQRIVDSLGRSTRRAVSVHDPRGKLLAYNSHEGPVDSVRTASILQRQGPARSFAWSVSMGIDRATAPVRLPRNADLDMEPRVCCPVRFDGRLLGYLWLLDPSESLTEVELREVAAAADNAALAIRHEALRDELARGRERELLRDLLSDQADLRVHSADELIAARLVVAQDQAVAFVVSPVRGTDQPASEDSQVRECIEAALARVRDALPVRQSLTLSRPDHGVVVLTVRGRGGRCAEAVATAARSLHRVASDALGGDGGWEPIVGVGDAVPSLVDLHRSYRHARQSADVARVVRSFRPVADWSGLGVYQTLVDLPPTSLDSSSLHPGLARLLATREAEVWLRTLEVYLDLACDARAAAGTLSIQRGSLYHRLHRIEELAGVDLGQGSDRLALHLGLKVARLAGLLDPPTAV